MKVKELLATARQRFNNLLLTKCWVDALVLRKYMNGHPESFRVDDLTHVEIDVPADFTHVLVVFEMPVDELLRTETISAVNFSQPTSSRPEFTNRPG